MDTDFAPSGLLAARSVKQTLLGCAALLNLDARCCLLLSRSRGRSDSEHPAGASERFEGGPAQLPQPVRPATAEDRPRTLGLRLSRLAAWLMSMSGGLVPLIYTV